MGRKLIGKITETQFLAHKALGKLPKLTFQYQERYRGGGDIGMVNGLPGSKSHTDGQWQGFEKDDLIAVIDLGRTQKIASITAGFLQNISSWIFLPTSMEFAVSANGTDFRTLEAATNDVPPRSGDIMIQDFSVRLEGIRARYVRVQAKDLGVCPDWHPGSGGKAWLFTDEIIVR